jgi:hypothetical protein
MLVVNEEQVDRMVAAIAAFIVPATTDQMPYLKRRAERIDCVCLPRSRERESVITVSYRGLSTS